MSYQMEIPKDYSCEDMNPVPAIRTSSKRIDGGHFQRRHRESVGIDPNELLFKLKTLSKEEHQMYAMDSLKQHYNSVFPRRRKEPTFKVFLEYKSNTYGPDGQQERETYVIRVERNHLREVKTKLPIKGSFRFFFKHGNTFEEIEDEDLSLPYFEKDGCHAIHCQLILQ